MAARLDPAVNRSVFSLLAAGDSLRNPANNAIDLAASPTSTRPQLAGDRRQHRDHAAAAQIDPSQRRRGDPLLTRFIGQRTRLGGFIIDGGRWPWGGSSVLSAIDGAHSRRPGAQNADPIFGRMRHALPDPVGVRNTVAALSSFNTFLHLQGGWSRWRWHSASNGSNDLVADGHLVSNPADGLTDRAARPGIGRDALSEGLSPSQPWAASNGYAAKRSLTESSPRSSATHAPTSSNARIRLRGDGMYAVK